MVIMILSLFRKMTQVGLNGYTFRSIGTYEDAIRALNSLQSNATYLKKAKQYESKLDSTRTFLHRSGMSLEQLDELSVIHIAGTKGKGSTCAFAESILRQHGIKTGLYTSPHLISVRERFRINGVPIGEDKFAKYFWELYKSLYNERKHETDMPPYFAFLTLLMFHIFAKEPIDVAIIEVGIGGEFDSTNIVRNPVCVGISSLGLDHTELLGKTLPEIAYQKSGIFKKGAIGFTVPQPVEAMRVLEERAIERNCSLTVVPAMESLPWPSEKLPELGIASEVQYYNASLAVCLTDLWMTKNSTKTRRFFSLDAAARGLTNCKCPGRTQILHGEEMDFYLDGAHTAESIECCAKWFAECTKHSTGKRILIYNSTRNRDSVHLLSILRPLRFDRVFFSPNIAGHLNRIDQINYTITNEEKMQKCHEHQSIWGDGSVCSNNVYDALKNLRNERKSTDARMQVLITGSLHLVGAALAILDPDLSMSTKF